MVVIEGKIVNFDGIKDGQVLIEDGVIKKVGSIGKPDILTNSFIFPGFIDLHVHAREDITGKQNYKEDFNSAGKAAINGGVTFIAEMPNNPCPPVDDESYEKKQSLTQNCDVGVLLYAGVGQNTKPLKKNVPYKVFMGQSVGELFFNSNKELEHAIEKYRGKNVSFHCEDEQILIANKDKKTHEKQRPRQAEIEAIKHAIELIRKYELTGKICHCSTKEGLELIRQAKNQGVKVTCEVTPHHLFFDESMIIDFKPNFLKMNPPLREASDCKALLEGLKDGSIDYLATDHAPHLAQEKEEGCAGVPNLDTFSKIACWLMDNGLNPEDISRVCAYNPGGFLNQFSNKKLGKIEEGYTANLTVLNCEKKEQVNVKSKCGWSPFENLLTKGVVEMVFIHGKQFSP
ncbi:MAG: dihydroorotase [Candidatus Nanoarchaeia archaeon]